MTPVLYHLVSGLGWPLVLKLGWSGAAPDHIQGLVAWFWLSCPIPLLIPQAPAAAVTAALPAAASGCPACLATVLLASATKWGAHKWVPWKG